MSRTTPALAATLLALTIAAAPARAGIQSPLSLGIIFLDAKNIVVLEVEEFQPKRGVVVYKKVADLKGKHAGKRVRHGNVPVKPDLEGRYERRGPPLETLTELLEPGRRVVFFHNGGFGVVYLGGGCWCSAGAAEDDAVANWGIWLPQYGFGYAGTVEQLQQHVRAMLEGKEVVVAALAATPAAGAQVFSLFVEPRRLTMPLWQIRAGPETLRLPAGMGKRFVQDYGTELDEEAKKLVVAKGSGRAAEVKTLAAGLKDTKATARRRHADELGLIGPEAKAATPALAGLLKDEEPAVRLAAATALVRIVPGHRAAGELLLEALKDKNASRRLEAVDALWSLGRAAPSTVPALTAALVDPEKKVRERATPALQSLLRSATSADPVTVADLVVALSAKDEACRRLAVCGLRHKPTAQVKPVTAEIVKVLKDPDAWVRAEAAGTLARLDPKHEAIVPVLVEILKDKIHTQVYPGGMIRKAALDALGRVGSAARPALPALIEAIEEFREIPEVVGILKQLGSDAAPAAATLRKALKGPPPAHYPELPLLAAATLAHVAPGDPGNEPAVELLIATVKDRMKRFHDRALAVEALGRFGAAAATAVPALEEALKDQFDEVGQAAAKALKQIRGK